MSINTFPSSLATSGLLARDVMTGPIVNCDPSATLADVAALFSRHRIHCVLVSGTAGTAGRERLVWGVIGDLDLLHAALRGENATAGQLAGTEALTVGVDDDLETVGRRLADHDVSHAIVVADEEPVGIVSTLDLAGVVAGP